MVNNHPYLGLVPFQIAFSWLRNGSDPNQFLGWSSSLWWNTEGFARTSQQCFNSGSLRPPRQEWMEQDIWKGRTITSQPTKRAKNTEESEMFNQVAGWISNVCVCVCLCSSYFMSHCCCLFGDICSSCCCVLVCIRCLVNSHQNVLMHEWISYRHVGKCMFTFRNFQIYTVCLQLSYHGKRSSCSFCVSIRFPFSFPLSHP